MKYRITLGALLLLFTANAQDTTYNRVSIDAQFGLNNPISPMATQYDAATFGLYHVGLGVRYAINTKFGLRLGGNFDHFQEREGTPDFSSEYYRISLEGVANIGNIMDFQTWTRRIGLLLHTGVGYSILNGSTIDANHMMHGVFGLTPQVRLSERFNLYLDGSVMANVYQNYTYDLRQPNQNRGVDGFLYNFSLGLQYNLGRHARHADWAIPYSAEDDIQSLQDRIDRMEQQQRDDDGDGVPNYLDEEPGTPAGTTVDTKGRTVVKEARDSDSDNIPDDVDDCPFEKGTPAMHGCPDRSGSSVDGSGNNAGSGSATVAMVENSEVKFETDRSDISPSFAKMLDGIAGVMKDNPSYKLTVTGHADDRASEEYNMALSQRRADAVRSYLVSKGIASDRITTKAMGESQPKVNSTTVEARAENRRVQFDIR